MGYFDANIKKFVDNLRNLSIKFDSKSLQSLSTNGCRLENLPRSFELLLDISENLVAHIGKLENENDNNKRIPITINNLIKDEKRLYKTYQGISKTMGECVLKSFLQEDKLLEVTNISKIFHEHGEKHIRNLYISKIWVANFHLEPKRVHILKNHQAVCDKIKYLTINCSYLPSPCPSWSNWDEVGEDETKVCLQLFHRFKNVNTIEFGDGFMTRLWGTPEGIVKSIFSHLPSLTRYVKLHTFSKTSLDDELYITTIFQLHEALRQISIVDYVDGKSVFLHEYTRKNYEKDLQRSILDYQLAQSEEAKTQSGSSLRNFRMRKRELSEIG